MDVAPHPHIGLQTVSWLTDGEVLHNDSLGSEALLRPGGVNVMTSGAGIAHSEQTPAENTGRLNGVQLWIALPDSSRRVAPVFEHVPSVPSDEIAGAKVQVFSGAWGALACPSTRFTDLVAADVEVRKKARVLLPLDVSFEHAVLLLRGDCSLFDAPLERENLYYLPPGCPELACTSVDGARLVLIGGPPFPEKVLMWWNFVARTAEEIAQAREDWDQHRRFGEVKAYTGPRLEAPELGRLATPNPIS
jgi:redox-sensitive bicupin YhaK (pirin superfamily)